jgi:putative membrane protein
MVAMSSATLWIKAFNIVFVASRFAGRLFLPRLSVNLAMVPVVVKPF